MKLRAPSVPLITVDPYFSVWSAADRLYDADTVHWTGKENVISGTVTVDGETFSFMGKNDADVIRQTSLDISAMFTEYKFSTEKITLSISFFSTLFTDDLYLLSRPASYMAVKYSSNDGKEHKVSVKITADETLCTDKRGDLPIDFTEGKIGEISIGRMGTKDQKVLNRSGDDLRIDWGYFYLCTNGGTVNACDGRLCADISLSEDKESLVVFAYDDIKSLIYFGKQIDAYWRKSGKTFEQIIEEAFSDYEKLVIKGREFSSSLYEEALLKGGEKYAELLSLAYRQVIAAHKLAVDEEGNNIFVSKECFSNGCAATVDVTYPSAPLFIKYNTELLKGMLRPVFRYAQSDAWEYDFAPHDVGQYPILNGQVYAQNRLEYQMPVEECGNMLILCAAITEKDGNSDFVQPYTDTLAQWCEYLITYGEDPGNQLCTDDFAGHLAHNCNLSLKAIFGIVGYSKILRAENKNDEAEKYMKIARDMAKSWTERAANSDGSFRLAFDRPESFSMKYNIIWDKIFKTNIFPPSVIYSEFSSYRKHIRPFGLPLDERSDYTKSDWLVWCACMAYTKEEFEEFIEPLWKSYHYTSSRVPMTDWYFTSTSIQRGFQNRTVQGGLFIKLLMD